jgi:uncharacterized membrane protein YjgN (DUF898 family)
MLKFKTNPQLRLGKFLKMTALSQLIIIDIALISILIISTNFLTLIDFDKDKEDGKNKTSKIAEGSAIVSCFMILGVLIVTSICALNTYTLKKLCNNLESL